jgi:hypothetical protein
MDSASYSSSKGSASAGLATFPTERAIISLGNRALPYWTGFATGMLLVLFALFASGIEPTQHQCYSMGEELSYSRAIRATELNLTGGFRDAIRSFWNMGLLKNGDGIGRLEDKVIITRGKIRFSLSETDKTRYELRDSAGCLLGTVSTSSP